VDWLDPQGSYRKPTATHAAIYNTFYTQRHLISRTTLRHFRRDGAAAWPAATG
jgi:putative transposase